MALKSSSQDDSVQSSLYSWINKAIAEYITYLASNDSDEVRVDRAPCAVLWETKRMPLRRLRQ